MNSHPQINTNLRTNASQVSVLRLEEINSSQVVPLHILENDINQEILIPHVYLSEGSLPLLLGTENDVISIENQIIPVINETESKTYQQSNNTHTRADKSHTQGKSLIFIPNTQKTLQNYQTKPYNEVIPNSSNRYAINNRIELIHPLNCASNYSTINEYQARHSSSSLKTKFDSSVNQNPPSSSSQATEIKSFLNQPLEVTQNPLDIQIINPQPMNYTSKPANRKTQADISSKDNVSQPNKTRKRKVQNYIHISDVKVPQRAVAVLPTALQLRGKDIIFPKRTLPARIRFGPVQGIRKIITPSQAHNLVSKADTPVFLLKKEDDISHIDVTDRDKCNWMGLLPLGGEANVWLYQENDELYGITTEPINTRKPLKLGYGKKYAEDHNLPSGIPTMDLETVLSSNPKQWWCNECNRALPSATVLQRHADIYHKDDIISTRGGYRCSQCRRMFSRLFTLRRHLSKHCVRKPVKPVETAEPNSPLNLNMSLNNEESRIPSDESFQNFTNGLDFSTSLFDTDRISNLDISGNSRADDFNPYDITFRDDTTSNDLGFSKLTSGPSNTQSSEANKESVEETCTYCNELISNNNGRKHVSKCPSRKLDCACGRSFRNSEKLAQHYLKEHSENNASKSTAKQPEKLKYTCEQCKSKRVSFKRRGMLVNHLWRAHRIVSTSKVERMVRHYPCVACPKIYRSAAKRDRHILVHHPGAEKLRALSIEGGVKSCEPAVCEQCPRQYATRAKLLQHTRAQHPHVYSTQFASKKPTTKYW